jgi:SAM-dependent methyltransferase
MSRLRAKVRSQFRHPTGVLGHLAGAIMARRPSNRRRNAWTLEQLAIQTDDHILEIGYGPGRSITHAAALAPNGRVVGVDHSVVMWRQASRRNRATIAAGSVELRRGTIDDLADLPGYFHKVLAVNVFIFWPDPVAVLRHVAALMVSRGILALTVQPRGRNATAEDAQRAGRHMAAALREAGFVEVVVRTLPLTPVDAVCALGRRA